jgi:hypothetical protein
MSGGMNWRRVNIENCGGHGYLAALRPPTPAKPVGARRADHAGVCAACGQPFKPGASIANVCDVLTGSSLISHARCR